MTFSASPKKPGQGGRPLIVGFILFLNLLLSLHADLPPLADNVSGAQELSFDPTSAQSETDATEFCSDAVPIPLPLVQNGIGEFCWVTGGTIDSLNCWNVQAVEINGVSFANQFSTAFPPRINGNYYIHYRADDHFAHLEIAGTTIPASGVSLSPAKRGLRVGGVATLTATVAPANASNKQVTWSSSNPTVARVDPSGTVTALAEGSAIITATTRDGDHSADSEITVGNIPVTSVAILPFVPITFTTHASTTLTAAVQPANASDKTVVWSSSDPTIATVDASGRVTGQYPGSVTIIATSVDGGFTATALLHIPQEEGPRRILIIPPITASIGIGMTTTFSARVFPASSAGPGRVAWYSSNSAVATVTLDGVVTGVGVGRAVIHAIFIGFGTEDKAIVTVTSVPPPCPHPSSLTLPFVREGIDDTCIVTTGSVSSINSWNMQRVEINGVDFTNKWANQLPPAIDGSYYIRYMANVPWAHLEVN